MFVFNLEITAGQFKKSGYFSDRNERQIKVSSLRGSKSAV